MSFYYVQELAFSCAGWQIDFIRQRVELEGVAVGFAWRGAGAAIADLAEIVGAL